MQAVEFRNKSSSSQLLLELSEGVDCAIVDFLGPFLTVGLVCMC